MTDPSRDDQVNGQSAAEADESLGFFPSWKSLYWSVFIYTVVSILVLYWITVAFDFRVA